jgi:hypothetical protein
MSTRKLIRPLQLVIEKHNGKLWGRVKLNGNLMVDYAGNLVTLKKKLIKLAYTTEKIQIEDFEVSYDLVAFFESHVYLTINDIALRVGINNSLMRQYAAGIKYPSESRVKQIEDAIRLIGKELSKVKLHKPQKLPQ